MMCQCRFILGIEGIILKSEIGNEAAMHVWEQGIYGKIPVPPSEFCHVLKSALKNKVFFLKKVYTLYDRIYMDVKNR